jgi:hypothetical protein
MTNCPFDKLILLACLRKAGDTLGRNRGCTQPAYDVMHTDKPRPFIKLRISSASSATLTAWLFIYVSSDVIHC